MRHDSAHSIKGSRRCLLLRVLNVVSGTSVGHVHVRDVEKSESVMTYVGDCTALNHIMILIDMTDDLVTCMPVVVDVEKEVVGVTD